MIRFQKPVKAKLLCAFVLSLGLLSGCLDNKKTDTGNISYTPEARPLGVIAGEGAEYAPGSDVTLTGRLVGTVTNQTLLWEQIEGDPIQGITNWNQPNLTFKAPQVDGIKSFKFQVSARDASGAIIKGADGNPLADQVAITVFDPSILITFEVEDSQFATLNGVPLVAAGDANFITGASGSHTADITPGSSVTFNIKSGSQVAGKTIKAGFYTLYVQYAIPSAYGGKVAQVAVNGVKTNMQFEATGSWEKFRVGTVKLNEGNNVLEIGGGWSYYRIDNITLIPAAAPAKPLPVAPTLVNANATSEAKDLMAFLVSGYGSKIISGQTEFMNYGDAAQTGLREFDKVVSITGGDAPAIVAFDLMDYSSSRINCGAKPGTLSEDMIAAHKQKNVILAPLWHWNSPTKLKDATCSGSGETAWYSGFYTKATNFNLATALADTNSADYLALIADIDKISAELQKFADAGIPLLWRPLHEAQGGWFWWGASGPDELKALWRLMYNRMTVDHHLNNLIWVFTNTGDSSAAWYPGDDVVDIVGYDGYDGKNAGNPFKSEFSTLKDRFDGKKLVGLTETGTIPNVATMRTENAYWAFFVTWNSGGDYGPANADPAVVKATYADDNTVNLQDVPGGRPKVNAGLYSGFELSTQGFGAQVGWADTTGITTSSDWASSGSTSLAFIKDLAALGKSSDIVLQTYPVGGLDIKNKTSMTVKVHAADAGSAVNAQLFVKDKDYAWKDNGTVNLVNGSATLTLDVTGINKLSGFGVRFNGVDGTSTAAKFYIDEITLSDGTSSKVIYDFEPGTDGFGAQIGWSDTTGITTSTEWAKEGVRSLALYKNLSTLGSVNDIVLQAYPEKGLDVKGKSTLSVSVHATGAGNALNAKLFVKDKNYAWSDSGAVNLVDGSADLSIDVSSLDYLSGFGVDFNGADGTSTNAKFFVDKVTLDGVVLYSFEGTGAWEFQVNWTGTTGIQLANDWAKSGTTSIAGVTQLKAGDDNIVLQVYPTGGLLLGDVTKLKVSVHAKDAGNAVKAQLFAKDKNFTWKDGGAVALVNGSADLVLDISEWHELSGFGVRFMGPDNSVTQSRYYLDDVIFE